MKVICRHRHLHETFQIVVVDHLRRPLVQFHSQATTKAKLPKGRYYHG
jgi:hypothetical protein